MNASPKTAVIALLLAVVCPFPVAADTAILVALPSELDAVHKEIRLVGQPVELAGHRIFIGYRKGEKLYVVRTGAGNLNSAMVTQALVTRYPVDRIISIGVAGCLAQNGQRTEDGRPGTENRQPGAPNGHIGDILIVTNVVSHQAGKETPIGFEAQKQTELSAAASAKAETYRQKCEELRKWATEIAAGIPLAQAAQRTENREPRTGVRVGKLVSGDSFIASSAKREWLRETFNADAVDMVSAGIARVCEANGVPYVLIRVLSDHANETASQDFAAFVRSFQEPITAPIAIKLLDALVATAPALTK